MLPSPGDKVCAGVDLGLRSDSSALVIIHKRGPLIRVAEIAELRPKSGEPLKPSVVCRTFAERLVAHGASYAMADAHYHETLVEYFAEYRLSVAPAPTKPAEAFVKTRAMMRDGRLKIPRHPRLIQQLSEVEGRPSAGGGMSITMPRWSTGGHGDIVSALVLAAWQLAGETIPEPEPVEGTSEWEDAQRERRAAKAQEQRKQGWRLGWKR